MLAAYSFAKRIAVGLGSHDADVYQSTTAE